MAQTATILSGASQSNTISIKDGTRIAGLLMPAGWDAAAITLLGSVDNTNFFPVHDAGGTEISYTVAANRIVDLSTTARRDCLRFFKLRSGNTGAPVNQTADRAILVLEETLVAV
jgi:hypothetical protein